MMYKKEIYSKALAEIKNRRNMARLEQNMHFQEIEKKLPEIIEINSQLAQTGKQIITIIQSGKNTRERIEELKKKNLQAQQMIKSILVQNGYPQDYLVEKFSCEKCSDTGFVNDAMCSCLKNLVISMTVADMNKSARLTLSEFENFDINFYHGKDTEETQKIRETMRKIFMRCREYAENFSRSSGSILMFGHTGLGKTHLSLAIAKEVLNKGYSVLYDSTPNFLDRIKNEHFSNKSGEDDTLSYLFEVDLLILDDLGVEYNNPFFTPTIYNIINTRINKGLPTIINTNLNHEQMLEKYDERIVSRLFAGYESLEFVGMDIRLVKRKMGV
ncbi:MAG: DNA replication protein DnaC [Ruminococcus sp.]|nr:DNA replication protein DnaC [Ruminococcus sp.]